MVSPVHLPSSPPVPSHRTLRGYAFDPGLTNNLRTAMVSEVLYRVPWEPLGIDDPQSTVEGSGRERIPGPCGEYVEIVDIDPASRCLYAPVNLDDPVLLAQDGLAPSEGNPQFHQQMVYAVAMTTIARFERALGRRAMWAGNGEFGDDFVPRLRIYPHALREPNAYYSPKKKALLFGYFPAVADKASGQFPGGMVFTCLSHDVIAHETTHALLDGFHKFFLEPTNPDVLAFHEAFADVVALFQHFTFPEVLRHQIAQTRGDIDTEQNLLSQMATQFGHAAGTHGALRDAIGGWDAQGRKWVAHDPDPNELDHTLEPHERGAILVAAVFDAFLQIYRSRTRDLMRLATGGTGVLRPGEIHPDLCARLASEAAKTAGHVLNMCIRGLDYCPPVDLTFGEYLRALITADMDLYPADHLGYRVAFIEAFRRRGIYPRDVRTLSENSLRWVTPGAAMDIEPKQVSDLLDPLKGVLRKIVGESRYLTSRRKVWEMTVQVRKGIHDEIERLMTKEVAGYRGDGTVLEKLTGLALCGINPPKGVRLKRNGAPSFQVHAFREARRLRDDGRILNQVFITILQREEVVYNGETHTIRCGSTFILDLDEGRISYVVKKGLGDFTRLRRTAEYQAGDGVASLATCYFGPAREEFASLHRRQDTIVRRPWRKRPGDDAAVERRQ